jgi:hypothetical protein
MELIPALPYYRQLGAVGNDLSNWGLADGENGWDLKRTYWFQKTRISRNRSKDNQPMTRYRFRSSRCEKLKLRKLES